MVDLNPLHVNEMKQEQELCNHNSHLCQVYRQPYTSPLPSCRSDSVPKVPESLQSLTCLIKA